MDHMVPYIRVSGRRGHLAVHPVDLMGDNLVTVRVLSTRQYLIIRLMAMN